MTVTNGYLTSEEGVEYVGQNSARSASLVDDAINSVSRLIDRYCGRHFYQVTEARTFEVEELDELCFGPFNDLTTLTTLKVDADGSGSYETTITDYQLEPYNAAISGEPYLELNLLGGTLFPSPVYGGRENLIEITGVWGWPSVPPEVKQAARFLLNEHIKLQDAPLGTVGGEFGISYARSTMPARVADLLGPYRHPGNFGLA